MPDYSPVVRLVEDGRIFMASGNAQMGLDETAMTLNVSGVLISAILV